MKRTFTEAEAAAFRQSEGFKPRKLCSFFLEGRCQKGTSCTFAHSQEELHPDVAGLTQVNPTDGNLFEMAAATGAYEQSLLGGVSGLEGFLAQQAALAQATSMGSGIGDTKASPTPMPVVGDTGQAGQSFSSLQGPREFTNGHPARMCSLWLRHPALCLAGDQCPHGHGLMEMGLDVSVAVRIETASDETPAIVQVHSNPLGKGNGAPLVTPGVKGLGKGKADRKGAAPQNRFAGTGYLPSKICQFWIKNPQACQKGDACTYAHGVQELRPDMVAMCGISRFHNTGFKPTQQCKYFSQGTCTMGMSCTFAHGEEELSQRT